MYVGKDSYGILHHKPFVETVAPLSVESMLEPMKLRKTPKKQCQNEPWDLSIRHSDQIADVSTGGSSLDNNNTSKEQAPVHDEEQLTPIPEPGENVEVGCFGEMAVPVNQCMETDDLCYRPTRSHNHPSFDSKIIALKMGGTATDVIPRNYCKNRCK